VGTEVAVVAVVAVAVPTDRLKHSPSVGIDIVVDAVAAAVEKVGCLTVVCHAAAMAENRLA